MPWPVNGWGRRMVGYCHGDQAIVFVEEPHGGCGLCFCFAMHIIWRLCRSVMKGNSVQTHNGPQRIGSIVTFLLDDEK